METSARPDAVVSSRRWTVEAHATFGDGDSHDEHLVWLVRPSSPVGGRYARKLQCHDAPAARPMKAKAVREKREMPVRSTWQPTIRARLSRRHFASSSSTMSCSGSEGDTQLAWNVV
jgi:hypothetical protein